MKSHILITQGFAKVEISGDHRLVNNTINLIKDSGVTIVSESPPEIKGTVLKKKMIIKRTTRI